ncbi:MAG: hypothetical protein ABGY96_12620 [bacterium]|nr:hypothetical protein [Gammaproteobacteria bacterium]
MYNLKIWTALVFYSLFSTAAMAGSSIEDTHFFRLGVYKQEATVRLGATIDPFPPVVIDLADDLNSDDSTTAVSALYRWHFTKKWSLSLAYRQLALDGGGLATKDFNFDGKDFTAGGEINTEFNLDTYLVDIGYSFIRNNKWEMVVGMGLHAFDIESSISGQISVTDGSGIVTLANGRANADVLAPLPNLRGAVTYMINPKWEVNASFGWLSVEIDQIKGDYTYFDFATEYRITDRFGIGATYEIADIDVTVKKISRVEKYDLEFKGPSLYISYGF